MATHSDYNPGSWCGQLEYRTGHPYNPGPESPEWRTGYCDGWSCCPALLDAIDIRIRLTTAQELRGSGSRAPSLPRDLLRYTTATVDVGTEFSANPLELAALGEMDDRGG